MGASDFSAKAIAKTAAEAFSLAKKEAQHESGHGGYTGTIAEKSGFRLVTPNAGETPDACADRLMSDDEHWVQDKWGDAACIDGGPAPRTRGKRIWIFFGYASC